MNFPEEINSNYRKSKSVSPRSRDNKYLEPIDSYGVICFNIDPTLEIYNRDIENFFYNKFINISEFNYSSLSNIDLIPYFYNRIKILMIRRQNSLHYIEFLRGKYDTNNIDHIKRILSLMSRDENIKIRNGSFDSLWDELWKDTAKNKMYQREYNISKKKFDFLKENNFYGLLSDKNLSVFTEPEWGFPKGRMNQNEKKIDCAVRELYEETNININLLHILERVNSLEEEYVASNMISYRHIYYLASSDTELEFNNNQTYEVGEIGWFTISDALKKIRPYYDKRINLVHQIYFFIIGLINDIKKSKAMTNVKPLYINLAQDLQIMI